MFIFFKLAQLIQILLEQMMFHESGTATSLLQMFSVNYCFNLFFLVFALFFNLEMFLTMQVNVHILLPATIAAKPGALSPQPQLKLMLIIVGL